MKNTFLLFTFIISATSCMEQEETPINTKKNTISQIPKLSQVSSHSYNIQQQKTSLTQLTNQINTNTEEQRMVPLDVLFKPHSHPSENLEIIENFTEHLKDPIKKDKNILHKTKEEQNYEKQQYLEGLDLVYGG